MASGGHVLVTNAGTHPELQHAARALHHRGQLTGYRTSLAWSENSPVVRLARRRPVGALVRQRSLRGLPPDLVGRRAALLEVAYQVAIRTPYWGVADRLLRARTVRFDQAVARELRRSDGTRLVLAQATGARAILEAAAAQGIPTLLNCAIAHHQWMERCLAAEAELNPAWAGTLQHHAVDPRWAQRLDEEIALASILLVASSFSASTYVAAGVDPARILVVPLGVHLPDRLPAKQQRPDGGLRILFAGMLTQRKGLSYLVDAVQAADLPPSSRLVLAGQSIGDAAAVCQRYPRVDVLGQLSKSELDIAYRDADVVVLPSLVEGFGLVGLEAMARGLPTVVSSHTFGADIIRHRVDGYVVPAGEVAPLASVLTELAASAELRARVGRAAAARAQEFTWESYGTSLLAAIERTGLL